jgi:hypothetical protein
MLAQVILPVLIGRQGARESFWDATLHGVAAGTPNGVLAEPAYVFGAAARGGNRKTEPRGVAGRASLRDSMNCFRYRSRKEKKAGTIRVRALDKRGHIRVRPPLGGKDSERTLQRLADAVRGRPVQG